MTAFVIFVAAIIMIVAPLLHRDLERAEARRRTRERLAAMRHSFEQAAVAIGTALLPALSSAVKAASDLQAAMRQVQITLDVDTTRFDAAALRVAMRAAMQIEKPDAFPKVVDPS